MNTSKLISAVMTLLAINSFVVEVSAQQTLPTPLPKCRAVADQIYYVDNGRSVTDLHPGSDGGYGYQLNILGRGVDKFALVKEPHMKSVSLVFANGSQAKWQIYFEPNMARVLSSVRMRSECTGRAVDEHPLVESVKLHDQ
jgi:hypothetical protein